MPDCFRKPTARPFPRPKAVLGTPTATTSCRGTATLAGTACSALVKPVAPRRQLAVVVMLSTPVIAAPTAVCIIVGGIMFMLTSAVAAPWPITDPTGLAADRAYF
jgi:hypothetical protein